MCVTSFGLTSLSQGNNNSPCSNVVAFCQGLSPLSFVRKNSHLHRSPSSIVINGWCVISFGLNLLSQVNDTSLPSCIVASLAKGWPCSPLLEKTHNCSSTLAVYQLGCVWYILWADLALPRKGHYPDQLQYCCQLLRKSWFTVEYIGYE